VSRLRAKLEQMRELERQAVDDVEAAAHGRRLIGRRSGEDDRERLRGIPMIGGAAGAPRARCRTWTASGTWAGGVGIRRNGASEVAQLILECVELERVAPTLLLARLLRLALNPRLGIDSALE